MYSRIWWWNTTNLIPSHIDESWSMASAVALGSGSFPSYQDKDGIFEPEPESSGGGSACVGGLRSGIDASNVAL
jgi:hypothetical protein